MGTPEAGPGEQMRFRAAWDRLIAMPQHQPPGPAALAREMGLYDLNGRLVALRTKTLLADGWVKHRETGRWCRPESQND